MDKTEMPLFDVLSDSETFSPSKATQEPIGGSVTNTGGANRSRKYNAAYMDHKYGDRPVKEYEPKETRLEDTEAYKATVKKITRFVRAERVTTYGAIARHCPETNADTLKAAIYALKDDGVITFDEHKPAPTIIRWGGEMRRRIPDWNTKGNSYLYRRPGLDKITPLSGEMLK